MQQEASLRTLATRTPNLAVLEIGLGPRPLVDRIQVMLASGVRYTGCDFQAVCERHQRLLREKDVDASRLRFLGNRVGTYAWSLMDLLRGGEQFDVVYLDGHHTFYVDLPALMLSHFLLRPGGYFLLDDIRWTLRFMGRHLYTHEDTWRFYHGAYNFDEYEESQQEIPHIGILADEILLKQLGYTKDELHSTPFWWALRKPAGKAAS
jgi:SAM-dependent methyltransferase